MTVVLLVVQVTDVCRGYFGGRRRRQVPAPAPGLHHDYGQITTSVVLLGVQVTDVRRGYLGGEKAGSEIDVSRHVSLSGRLGPN